MNVDVNIKEKIIVIVGPTAVGKTALSLALAKKYQGEIINGDSVQVFRGLDIGSAKATSDEQAGIPHHLIDIRNPDETYNVYDFKQKVDQLIKEISARGKCPIIVGGTGLYIQSVLYDYKFPTTTGDSVLRDKLGEQSPFDLHRQLADLDPASAEKIHPNNVKRVIRALEICLTTGEKCSNQSSATEQIAKYNATVIGLSMAREQLYERINSRVHLMLAQGLEAEVRTLYQAGFGQAQSMQAIGYKEWLPYFEGACSLVDVIEQIQKHSRRFAKRQFTWFQNKMAVNWFEIDPAKPTMQFDTISETVQLFLGKAQ